MKFTKDHEWVQLDDNVATVGITKHAAEQLGDVVYVELPDIGRTYGAGDAFAVVESVKAASDVYVPFAGQSVAKNDTLADSPHTVNEDPEGAGWFAKFTVSDASALDEMMDRAAYDAYLETL